VPPLLAALALLLCVPAGCTQKSQQAAPVGVPRSASACSRRRTASPSARPTPSPFREAAHVSPRPLNVPRKQEVPVERTPLRLAHRRRPRRRLELTLLANGDAGGHLSINGKPYRGRCRLVPSASASSTW
jgi:hypothetical protein